MSTATTAARPSYWEIVTAYVEEGYRAWQARDIASANAVENALGLSPREGIQWHRELHAMGLINMEQAMNGIGAYYLAPRGIAFAERMPDVNRVIAQLTAAINATGAADDEKRQASFSVRNEVLKTAINKGADVAIQNVPAIWGMVRMVYGFLPEVKF